MGNGNRGTIVVTEELSRYDPGSADGFIYNDTAHEYTLGNRVIPHPTGLFQEFGLIDTKWYTEYSRERGRAIHAATHYDDENALEETSLDDKIDPYLRGWRKFREDTGFQPKFIEQPIYSRLYRFGTTPDRIGMIAGDWVICEIKTGDPHKLTAPLQTAAQSIATREFHGINAKRMIVKLSPNSYKVFTHDNRDDEDIFISLVKLHWYRSNI